MAIITWNFDDNRSVQTTITVTRTDLCIPGIPGKIETGTVQGFPGPWTPTSSHEVDPGTHLEAHDHYAGIAMCRWREKRV
jgi:hypothetical protein